MILPRDPRPAPSALTRRGVLMAGGAAALALAVPAGLAGCGPIRIGGPATYTPPPPGIDDLYRTDLIAVLDRAIAGTDALVGGAAPSDPALSDALGELTAALPAQRTGLLTGAQYEREQEAASDPAPGQTSAPPPADAPTDAAGLVDTLVELRSLATSASRQISGSLARPVAAIAAHTEWSVRRLHLAADAGEVPALPAAEEIVPGREVPETDPPSIGAETDYHSSIERAQQEEWYAGYVHEVLAARSEGEDRQWHLTLAERHRTRAGDLGAIAEEDGCPVVGRQAVYALPGGTLDDRTAGQLPALLARGLLVDHVSLVGAAPFARRPLSILAAMEEADVLVGRTESLEPLPGVRVEEAPVSDGG
ncbi:DUF4439 domain-containing protein [Brachybacterium sp. GCM10030267]|uniref:DUF4439 domain-containing protein n=1 Tax=Brachybacterium sp. GCM10030267 TaxID=3273381 RepID=UPI00361F564C